MKQSDVGIRIATKSRKKEGESQYISAAATEANFCIWTGFSHQGLYRMCPDHVLQLELHVLQLEYTYGVVRDRVF